MVNFVYYFTWSNDIETEDVSLLIAVVTSDRDEDAADAGVNGCVGDAAVLPSNASSHTHQLMNLQRNPQVMMHCTDISLFFSFIFKPFS